MAINIGQEVYFILIGETVTVIAKQEWLGTDEVAYVVETSDGRIYECCGYEVTTNEV